MKEVNVKKSFSQKMKTWKKRALAYVLSISMLLQTDLGVRVSFAADENPDAEVHVLVNGERIDTEGGNITKEFQYHEPLNIAMVGTPEGVSGLSYVFKTLEEFESGEPGKTDTNTLELGQYYLLYGYYEKDEYITNADMLDSENPSNYAYGFSVVPAEIAAAENLRWAGDGMAWDAVTKTIKNGIIEDDVISGYTVCVYKNDELVRTLEINNSTSSPNFGNNISSDDDLKEGKYTFTVQAKIRDEYKNRYASAAITEIAQCPVFSAPKAIINSEGAGISSAQVAGGTSSVVLVPGKSGQDVRTIEVTVKPGYDFVNDTSSWQVPEEVSGITFDSFSNQELNGVTVYSAKMHIANDYNGPTEILVTPVAKDQTAPSITSYTVGTQGTLSAAAQDDGTGIKYYAFSTETDAEKVDFKEVGSFKPGEFSVENEVVSKGGKYYFYVKDQDGNVTKTEEAKDVTEVNYHNAYENNLLVSDCREFITDTAAYTLKTSTRAGYTFEGWYSDEALTSKVENITDHNTETGYNLYAKWEAEGLEGAEVSSYSAVYDGEAHDLTVTLPTGLTGTIQYQWQKKNGENYVNVEGANAATYSVKDVKDSGDYQVIVSVEQSQVTLTLQSQVTITKATAKVKAKDYTISFLSQAPAYEIEFVEGFGLLESDGTEKNQVEQSIKEALIISCSYEKGHPVGNYYIYVKNKNNETATTMDLDNYTVEILHPNDQTKTGVLKVTTKEDALSAAFHPGEDEFDAAHPVFTYALDEQGNAVAYKPAVLVKDGEIPLTENTDYTIKYENNDKVGTAKAIVEFQGNYSGSITLEFIISAATKDVSIEMSKDEWIYGDATGVPQIVNKENLPAELQNAKVTYYYAKKSTPTETSTDIIKNAGEYQVYAVLSGMDNFEDITTAPVYYTVKKRHLILTAASLSGEDSCEYDGAVHQNKSYTLEGDFAPGEGFNSVIVALEEQEGAGLKVGTYKNKINYTLSSITKEDNYDIQVVEGEIVITPGVLSFPANAIWSMDKPGTITWVPISKENLEVSYEIKVYAKSGEEETLIKNGESDSFLVVKGELEQTPNSLDLSNIIREYAKEAAKENKAYTFYFTIQTYANGGANKENYVSGGPSEKVGPYCTAVVTLQKDDKSVASACIQGENPTQVLILQGEKIILKANSGKGFVFENNPWDIKYGYGMMIYDYSTEDDHSSAELKIYTGHMYQSTLSTVISVKAKDQEPEIVAYTGSNTDELSHVNLNFKLKDSANLKGWMITSTNVEPKAKDTGWEEIPEGNKLSYSGSKEISCSGEYYLWVKDAAGSVVGNGYKALVEDEYQMVYVPINVYEIQFDKGESAKDKNGNNVTPTGSMPSIYKVENSTIKLPEAVFDMEGFAFQNWHGTTGIYENTGNYGANANDTLVAYWTNHAYDYKVFYHYEDLDGTYPKAVESSNILTFNDLYGTEVSYDNGKIQKKILGFELDTNPEVYGGAEKMQIVVTEEGKELHVYYKRLSYNITYQVYLPGEEQPSTTIVTKKFGEILSGTWEKPQDDLYEGYHFVGWFFGETESNPTTMPASNITVIGRYEEKEAEYHIYKYFQKLDSDGKPMDEYELVSDEKYENMIGLHGDEIYVNASLAGEEEGFTYKGAIINQDKSSMAKPDTEAMKEADVAKLVYSMDHSKDICIHMYYTRNSYKVRLKVWQGEIGKTENLKREYEVDTLYYGAEIPIDKLAEYDEHKKDEWNTDIPETYSLLEDVFYSTGEAPMVMPAGDLTINRQYVNQLKGKYYVEIWMETDTDHVYTPYLFNYEGIVGDTVTLGNQKEGYTISYNSFENAIPYFKYYEYKSITSLDGISAESGKTLEGPEVFTGTITATEAGAKPLVLRVFLDRKEIPTTITYYYNDGTMKESKEFAKVTKKKKWGMDEASKYYYEPLAYFDTTADGQFQETISSKEVKAFIEGTSADLYDFRKNEYLVSYTARYDINSNDHYPARGLITEKSGNYPPQEDEKEKDTYPMGYANNSVKVYYTKPEPNKQKVVQIVYRKLDEKVDTPLTYNWNNVTYNIYVANEAYFYKDAQFTGGIISQTYPGLSYVKGEGKEAQDYTYTKNDGNIKDGFQRIEVNGNEYYIEADTNRIYIPDTSNQFYSGHMVYYAYPKDYANRDKEIGFDIIQNYMTQYEKEHDPVTIWFSNRSFGSTVIMQTDETDTQETLRITFYPREAIHAHFIINGVDCYQEHKYPYGRALNTATLTCNHDIHAERPGYEIVWYKNLETSEKYTGTVNPTGDLYLYGRYEKKILENKARAYYQLPYEVELDSNSYSFITENELAMLEGKYIASESTGIITYTYNDETNPNHGQVFMVEKSIPVESFKGVATSATDTDFVKEGFKYDSANADNMLSGYAEADPLNLRVYYVRKKNTVTINSGIPKTNKEIKEYLYGQKVEVTAPERGGYSFPGWTVSPENAIEELKKKDSKITFSMPDNDIVFSISQDAWNASAIPFEQEIWHYFQNTDLNYNTSLTGELNKATPKECKVIYNGEEHAGLYAENVGAYYINDNDTYYFAGGVVSTEEEATLYTVTAENLVAIKQVTTPKQNDTVNAGAYAKTEKYYNFSHINYRYDTDVLKLVKSEGAWPEFTVNHGMTVEYFYTLQADFTVNLVGKATDGKGVGQLQLFGAKDYFYGEEVHLKASVPAGYTFLGWYRGKDIEDAENGVVIKSEVEPISQDTEYSYICREGGDYVALIEAGQAAGASITPDGIKKLTYGYKASPSNAVTAKVSYDVEDHTSSRVQSYEWKIYKKDADGNYVELTGLAEQNGASFLIPIGLEAGDYKLDCEAVIENRYTGRTITTVAKGYELTIEKMTVTVSSSGYEEIYDAQEHSIKVAVNKKACENIATEIYYSATPLDETNYLSNGQKDILKYKNVKLDENKEVDAYTIYYYVVPVAGGEGGEKYLNYQGAKGSNTVTIKPKEITLSSGQTHFSKVYDGKEEVEGTLTDTTSDKYRLVHGTENIYEINGLLDEDSTNAYIIDCNAEFDNRHTTKAKMVTLSDIKLALSKTDNGVESVDYDTNYIFEDSYAITLSGYITKKPLEVTWDSQFTPSEDGVLEIVYDGTPLCPTAVISTDLPFVDKGYLTLISAGGQKNCGSYEASLVLNSTSEDTMVSDFVLSTPNVQYKILPRPIVITPVNRTVDYDGNPYTLEEYTLNENGLLENQGHILSCEGDKSYTSGTHDDIKMTNVSIKDSFGTELKDNYDISCLTGTLTITEGGISVSGIKVKSKIYDGTTNVSADQIDLSELVITGVREEDKNMVSIDKTKIIANYENQNVGEGKKITLDLSNALVDTTGGYRIVTEGENASQTEATADITKKTLTLSADNKAIVYGTVNPVFSVSYSGFAEGESKETVSITGEVSYKIAGVIYDESSLEQAKSYEQKTAVGSYHIYPIIDGLSADNYDFAYAKGTLTVSPRLVQAVKKTNASDYFVTKLYDGKNVANVGDNSIVLADYYEFIGVENVTESGLLEGDSINLSYTSAVYNSKDVKDASNITVSGLSIDTGNYTLMTDATNAQESLLLDGKITAIPLKIMAEEKKVTYGITSNPKYLVTYEGFLEEEKDNHGDLVGTIDYDCEYDCDNSEKRNVGNYDITPKGVTSDNYVITFVKNTLTVEPATLTVKLVKQNDSNKSTNGWSGSIRVVYGEDSVPIFEPAGDGLMYEDQFDLSKTMHKGTCVTGTMVASNMPIEEKEVAGSGVTKKVVVSPAQDYVYHPTQELNSCDNYKIVYESTIVTVEKHPLTVNGITIKDRTYDGTDVLHQKDVDTTQANFAGLIQVDIDHCNQYEADKDIVVVGTYESKDVLYSGDVVAANKVTFSELQLSEYLSTRYVIQDPQSYFDTCRIIPRKVTITAKEIEVTYGSSIELVTSKLDVTYEKATYDEDNLPSEGGFVKVNGTDTYETADKNNVTLSFSGYQVTPAYTLVGEYQDVITASNYDDKNTATAKKGNYEVEAYVQGTLKVTQAQLDAPEISWSDADGKAGTITWTEVAGIGDVTVAEYETTLYKDGVIVEAEGSTITHGSDIREYNYSDLIHAQGAGKYTVKIRAIASTENNTDYANVASSELATSTKELYAAEVSFVFASDEKTQNGKGGTITIHNADRYVMIAGEKDIPIRATIKNATGYTIKAVNPSNSIVEVQNPTDTARSENGGDGDTYQSTVSMGKTLNTVESIKVELQLNPRPATVSVTVSAEQSSVQYGYNETTAPKLTATVDVVEDNITTDGYTYTYKWYYLKNNKTEEFGTHSDIASGSDTISFPTGQKVAKYLCACVVTATRTDNGETKTSIKNIGFNPSNSYVEVVEITKASFTAAVAMDGWMYGESRKQPSVIEAKANGVEVTSVQHQGLNQVTYYYVEKASYDADHSVEWNIKIPTDAGEYYVKATIPESENYAEFTTEMKAFEIKPNKLSSPAPVSINVSDSAAYGHVTWTSAVEMKENAGWNAASEITVTYEIDVWKKNESDSWVKIDEIAYENQSDCEKDITHDIQNIGEYKVSITAKSNNENNCQNSDTEYSDVIKIGATIGVKYADRAAVPGEDGKYTKEYDGEDVILTAAYNGNETVISYDWYKGGARVQSGASNQLYIKHVEDSDSYTCAVILNKGDGVKEDIFTPYARINITPRPITLTSDGGEKVYDGQPLLKKEQGNVKDTKTDDSTVKGFVKEEGAEYSAFNETQINVGESNNTFTYTLKDGTKASDYTITQSYGAFKITKRPITFKGEMVSKMYTGEKQNSEGFSYTPNGSDVGIVNGHVVEVEYKAEGTEAGSYDGTFTAVKIYSDTNKAEEVTDNYTVTRTTGTLTITKSDADWTISMADSSEYTYKAEPYATDKVASSGAKTGVTSFKYSFEENGFEDEDKYVTDLGQLQKINAGTYPIYVQATNPNYSKVATTNANLIIKKRPVTFTGKSQEKAYTGSEITIDDIEVSGDGLVEGHNHNVVFSAKGTDSNTTDKPCYQGIITEKSAVKIYNGNEWSAENDVTENYDITVVAGTLRIKGLSAFTISMADSSNLTYNKLEQATNQLPDSSDAIQKSKITYSYSFTDDFETATTDLSTLTKVEAGTYPIYVWATHPDYSNTATCQANLIINKAPANIAITPVGSKTYGDSAFDLSVTKDTDGDSTFTSDNETVLMVDATGKVSIQNAGTAKLTVTTPETNNYLAGIAEIDITVAKKDATLIISNVTYNKTYGDDDFVIGDLTTEGQSAVTYESSDSTVASVDASGKVTIHKAGTAIITLKMAESGNYNEISTTATVIVSPKAITVTADHKEKIYGEDDSVFEYSCTPVGLVGQDTLQVSYEREEGENQGTYLITPVVTPDDNYVIDSVKGTLTIKKKAVIAELSIDNKVYDGSSMATVHATIPQNEMVGTDVIVIEGITAEFADANVGTQKTVTANVNEPQFSGSGYENYDITIVDSATADITAKQITVTITPNGGEYNGTIVPAEGALNGLVEGENPDITLLYSGTANDGTQLSGTDTIPPTLAGTYVVTASITDTNYELVGTVTSDYVVERAGANLQFTTGESKIYLDPDFTLEVTKDTDADVVISGGDSAVLELMNDYVVVIHDVGKATFTAHSEETANYAEGNATLTITVDKKESQLVITEIEYVKTYGDEDFTIGQISFDGESTLIYISDKEEVATIDATGMVSVKSVGEAIITVSAAESDHYKENSLVVKVRVEPKEVIVKAQDSSKVYAGEDPVFTYSTEGVVPGDQLTVSFIRAEGENVGDYEINPVVVEDSNYRIICKKGVLTIEPRDISNATVTLGSGLYYNEKEQHQEIQSVILTLEDGRELEVTYEVEDAKATKPGVYTLKVVGKGNFTGTTEKQFTIVQNEEVDNKFEIGEGYIVVNLKTEKETDQTSLITHKREIIEYLIETGDLDGEMLAMIADGGTIEIILHVKDGEKTVSSESKQLIQEHIEDFILGQYLDITLSIYVRKNDVIEKEIAIKETPDKIYLVLSVSQEMLADNPDGFSEICVVRNHDGQVEFLNTEYYESTQKLSFGTDRFSDYAIVYKKKVVENTMDENNSENQSIQNQDAVVEESNLDSKVKSPKTGDDTDLLLWYLAFAFCGAILTGSNAYVKRRKNRKF